MIAFGATEIPDLEDPYSQLTANVVATLEQMHHDSIPWDELTPMLLLVFLTAGGEAEADVTELHGEPTVQLQKLVGAALDGQRPVIMKDSPGLISASLFVETRVRAHAGSRKEMLRDARHVYGEIVGGHEYELCRFKDDEPGFRWYPPGDTATRTRGVMLRQLHALVDTWGVPIQTDADESVRSRVDEPADATPE